MTDESAAADDEVIKPLPEQAVQTKNTWWATAMSLLVYIIVYYALFRSFRHIFLLILVIIIHEGGHYLAMKIFGYKDIRMFFIPLIGAFVSGSSHSVSTYQRSLMILAGPVPGIFIGMILFLIFIISGNRYLFEAAMLFLLLNAFNLLPLSPLDGGQLLQTIYFGTNYAVQTLFTMFSIIAVGVIVFITHYFLLLILVLLLLMRLKKSYSLNRLRNKVMAEGVSLDKSFEQLNNQEYASIRKVLLKLFPEWDLPYDRSGSQEQEIAALTKVLIPGSPSGAISITQKSYLTMLWLTGLAVPVFALVHYFNNLR